MLSLEIGASLGSMSVWRGESELGTLFWTSFGFTSTKPAAGSLCFWFGFRSMAFGPIWIATNLPHFGLVASPDSGSISDLTHGPRKRKKIS